MRGLISAEWLQDHLDDPSVRVVESSIAKASYDEAHVPGAAWADSHGDLLPNGDDSAGYVITPEQFASLMQRLGVTPDTTVVWYGDRHSSYAIRGFWTMDYYKHPAPVYVLDGGREGWRREGRPVTATPATPPPAGKYPVPSSVDDANHADWQATLDASRSPGAVVLDVRALDEYTGAARRAARAGHIPGAAHVEWTEATAGDNILKSPDELRAMYAAHGVTPEKSVVTHCQLGIRAAHTWFVLKYVLGFPDVRNYDGSWQEWGNRDDLPIEA